MNPEASYAEIESLFYAAMEVPEPDRAAYIERRAGGNSTLQDEVASLVKAASAVDRLRRETTEDSKFANRQTFDSALGKLIGVYEIDRLLGRGGMGEVYAAHRAGGNMEQLVAVKIIGGRLDSPLLRTIFFKERDALARLHHPHIARLLDGGLTPENSPYLVMELVGSEASPARRLDDFCEGRQLAIRERVSLALDICDSVAYAHQKLIVHGDLKPGNVLVTQEGEVKLLDFGAARLLAADEDDTSSTALTPAYASPEQMQGKPIGISSDIYSMGKLLELIFGGRRDAELEAVLRKAMHEAPEDRYASMEQFAGDLRSWLNHFPVKAYSSGRSYVTRKWLFRNRAAAVASLIVLAVLAECILQTQASARRALAERDRAVRAAGAVEELAHRLLFDFQYQLNDLGASTDAQHTLATTTLNYLNELSSDPSLASDSLQLDVANAYSRMGNLLGNPYDQNLGKPKEAVTALQKALEAASALVLKQPSNKDARFSLAMAQRSLAEVEFGAGDSKSSLQAMNDSVNNFQTLLQSPNATATQLIEAASTLGSLGDVYGLPGTASMEKSKEAMECYRQQIEVSQRVLNLDPNNVRARRSVAIGEYKVANLIYEKDAGAAVAGYQRALASVAMLPKQTQGAAPTLRLLYLMQAHLGRAYAAQGKKAEAVESIRRAREEAALMVAKDPLDDRARYDLATTGNALAEAMVAAGNRREAYTTYQQALQAFDFMLARNPDNPTVKQHRRDVEESLRQLRQAAGGR